MNQILAHEKVYVTPELKRKKKIYKWDFCISVFLVLVLFSYYIYGEYDRARADKLSKNMTEEVKNQIQQQSSEQEDNTTVKMEDNVLVVILDSVVEDEDIEEVNLEDLMQTDNITTRKYNACNGRWTRI